MGGSELDEEGRGSSQRAFYDSTFGKLERRNTTQLFQTFLGPRLRTGAREGNGKERLEAD